MKHLLKPVSFIIIVVAFGLASQSCLQSKTTVDQTKLEGCWVLKTMNGEVANKAFEGNIPSLEFDLKENLIYGIGGCNRYSGSYSIEDNIFKVSQIAFTQMACIEANKESSFFEIISISSGLAISIENDILTFKENGGNIVLEFYNTLTESKSEILK